MSRTLQLLKLIGAGCVIYILASLDYPRLWEAFRTVDGRYLVAACGVNLLAGAAKSYRWKLLVTAQSGSISFARCFFIQVYLSFVANITPGRIGELFKMKYLNEAGFGNVKAVSNLALDRISDLVMMAALGVAAALVNSQLPLDARIVGGLAILGVAALVLVRFAYVPLLELMNQRIRNLAEGLVVEIREIRIGYLFASVPATLVAVILVQLQIYLIALGFGLETGFLTFLPIMLAANLVALLPISVSGLGTREVVLITLLGRQGVAPEVAALISLVDVFLVAYAFRGLLALLVKTFKGQLLPEIA